MENGELRMENYTARGMVLCIARQGIHRYGYGSPDGEQETGGSCFSIDMISLTGNA
jgi:hypothetical protein